jgi:hypothetical protein
MYVAEVTSAVTPFTVTPGKATALEVGPAGFGATPLGTAGVMDPSPVATTWIVFPGDASITAVFDEDGAAILVPSATNIPTSDVATLIRNGVLVWLPEVTVTFTEAAPAGISKGAWTFSCVGLIYRIGAARPPILTDVPARAVGALGG